MKFLKNAFAKRTHKLVLFAATLSLIALPVAADALAAGDVGSWTGTNGLNVPSTTAGAVAYNGFLYNVGGRDNSLNAMDQTQYAPINPNGSVGTWVTSTNHLPTAQWRLGVVENNGYLYSIGGLNGGGAVAGVYYAPINADGSIGGWTSTTPLSPGTHSSGVVVYSNHIFLFGGATSGNVDTVLSAPINSNGSVGTWTPSPNHLPQQERRQKAIEYNGYVYVMGGLTTSNSTSIFSAKLNSDGTIGSWTTLPTTLPAASIDFSLTENNGYAYLVGGNDGTNFLTSVYFAPLNGDGTMGAWTPAANPLLVGEEGTSSVVSNNILYVIGGDGTGSAAFNNVYYAPLTVPAADPVLPVTTTSSNTGAPDTGYGTPDKSSPFVVAVISIAVISTGAGLRLLHQTRKYH